MRKWPRGIGYKKHAINKWSKELGQSRELLDKWNSNEITWKDYVKQTVQNRPAAQWARYRMSINKTITLL